MGFRDMEPVWVQYGSGIALGLGFGGLTHRTVRSVKVLGESDKMLVCAQTFVFASMFRELIF